MTKEKEFFMRPICRLTDTSEEEATERILDAMKAAGIEVRGWA